MSIEQIALSLAISMAKDTLWFNTFYCFHGMLHIAKMVTVSESYQSLTSKTKEGDDDCI